MSRSEDSLHALLRFVGVRGARWGGPLATSPAQLSDALKWELTTQGRGLFQGERVVWPGNASKTRDPRLASQCTPPNVQRGLTWSTEHQPPRPIWNAALVGALRAQQTLSPTCYPHAAEDILEAFRLAYPRSQSAAMLSVAVWSSVTPWVELTLLQAGAGSLTTVDYNPPKIATALPLRTVDVRSLPLLYAGGVRFDVVVFFSGAEHDGLGRYGEPVEPNGDLMGVREIELFLKPGGFLLLGVPTAASDNIDFPWHRIYGPARLPRLIEGFTLRGWVWNGQTVRGGLERAEGPPTLWYDWRKTGRFHPGLRSWKHQPVLVLQKNSSDDPRGDR